MGCISRTRRRTRLASGLDTQYNIATGCGTETAIISEQGKRNLWTDAQPRDQHGKCVESATSEQQQRERGRERERKECEVKVHGEMAIITCRKEACVALPFPLTATAVVVGIVATVGRGSGRRRVRWLRTTVLARWAGSVPCGRVHPVLSTRLSRRASIRALRRRRERPCTRSVVPHVAAGWWCGVCARARTQLVPSSRASSSTKPALLPPPAAAERAKAAARKRPEDHKHDNCHHNGNGNRDSQVVVVPTSERVLPRSRFALSAAAATTVTAASAVDERLLQNQA